MRFLPLFALILLCITACSDPRSASSPASRFLNADSLPTQRFTVLNDRDTVLQGAYGARVRIRKGSFNRDTVRVELKEAYSLPQMILAGLTTRSDQGPLSSGGMISFTTPEAGVEIRQPIRLSVPTKDFDPEMQVYSVKDADGKIVWTDPKPLKADSSELVSLGRAIFQENCASCHAIDKILSGPALSGFYNRGPWAHRSSVARWLKNPAAFIPTTCYTKSLQHQYGQIMPSFPQLSVEQIDGIRAFIESEDRKRGIFPNPNAQPCLDSCEIYTVLRDDSLRKYEQQRSELIDDNGCRINWLDSVSVGIDSLGGIDEPITDTVQVVIPTNYRSVYYQFEIESPGWYNIDKLIKPGSGIELKVALQGMHTDSLNVFLIVPDENVIVEGGTLHESESVFGFGTRDGKVSLPEGKRCIVFAVGETGGELLFDWKEFVSSSSQRIAIEARPSSKRQFNRWIRKMHLDGLEIEARDSKNAKEIRRLDEEIRKKQRELEQVPPKNCPCDCDTYYDSDSSTVPSWSH